MRESARTKGPWWGDAGLGVAEAAVSIDVTWACDAHDTCQVNALKSWYELSVPIRSCKMHDHEVLKPGQVLPISSARVKAYQGLHMRKASFLPRCRSVPCTAMLDIG